MKESRAIEIKVGLVSISAIIIFIIGVMIGNEVSISSDYIQIKCRFQSSGSIKPTSPVFVNGVKRGKIVSVIPDNGSVLIFADIDNIDDFREDVSAKIGILEITGGKKMELITGNSNTKFDINAEIPGVASPDIGDMIALFADMGSDAKILLKKLDTIASAANRLIANENSFQRLEKTIEHTSAIAEELHIFISNNSKDFNIIIGNLRKLTDNLTDIVDKYEPKADTLISNLNLTLSNTQQLIKNAESAIISSDELITQIKEISKDIKEGKGLASKLIYDEQYSLKLDSTLNNLYEYIMQIKEHGININARLGSRP